MPLAVLNVACLWINHHPVPWSMTLYAFRHWDSYKKLIWTKIKEIPFLPVSSCAAILAIAGKSVSIHCKHKKAKTTTNFQNPSNKKNKWYNSWCHKIEVDIVQKKVLLSFVYALYANSVCPRKYKTICCSLVLSITLEVHQGYQQMMQTNASDDLLLKHESQTLANDSIKVQDPVNLVLLSFLKIFETVQHFISFF